MDCERYRDAFSARLDDEDPGLAPGQLDAHLDGCGPCRAWLAQAEAVTRLVRLAPARPVPDLSAAALARAHAPGAAPVFDLAGLARWGLALVALAQVVIALGTFEGRNHLTNELGAVDLALAAGFAYAAHRPARAWGMLPLVGAVVTALVVTAALDVTGGGATVAGESAHLLGVLGLLLLWTVARPERTLARRGLLTPA